MANDSGSKVLKNTHVPSPPPPPPPPPIQFRYIFNEMFANFVLLIKTKFSFPKNFVFL